MARKRRMFNSSFKAKVALDAVNGVKTVAELSQRYKVHPTQIALWKRQLMEGAETLFEGGSSKKEKTDEPEVSELYEQIGKLNVQLEWLKKKVAENCD